MKCEYCGTVIPDGAEECPACGAGIKSQTESPAAEETTPAKEGLRCRKCGTINDADSSYCKSCSDSLKEDCSKPCRLICPSCGHRFEKIFEYVRLTSLRTKISRGSDTNHRCDKNVKSDDPEFQIECQIKKTSCPECGGEVIEDPFSPYFSRQEFIRYSRSCGWNPFGDGYKKIHRDKIEGFGSLVFWLWFLLWALQTASVCLSWTPFNYIFSIMVIICLCARWPIMIIASYFIEKDDDGRPLFDENNWKQILREKTQK